MKQITDLITPGEWKANSTEYNDGIGETVFVHESENITGLICKVYGNTIDEKYANAKAIAASKRMLDILSRLAATSSLNYYSALNEKQICSELAAELLNELNK